jgi:hypothetical protein
VLGVPGLGAGQPAGVPAALRHARAGFTPLPESDVGRAAWRLGHPFAEVVFDGWTPAQLAAVPAAPGLADADLGEMTLPLGAAALFIELRARMHGP